MFHRLYSPSQIKTVRGRMQLARRTRTVELCRTAELLLPGALLVTIQAQLFAPFVLVDFCLAAFFD
jgi:hypothetical protein